MLKLLVPTITGTYTHWESGCKIASRYIANISIGLDVEPVLLDMHSYS